MRKIPCAVLTVCLLTVPLALSPGAGVQNERTIRITGGVGYRQFLRIGQWLADNLLRYDPQLNVWLDYHLTGQGFKESIQRVAEGKAEVCIINSRSVAAMAVQGKGLFQSPVPLRAIASLPHYDWSLFAVDPQLEIRSFADLRKKQIPLQLATGFMDGDNAVGFVVGEILSRHGIPIEEFRRWGGEFLPGGPGDNRDAMTRGAANAVAQEGSRGEEWEELIRNRRLVLLSMEPEAAKELERETGFRTLTVPANYYPGQDQPFIAPDFSDWLICVRQDMDDDLAYQLARIVVEVRRELEQHYEPDPPRYRSINTPLDPRKLGDTDPVRLHPGAARYYTEKGLR